MKKLFFLTTLFSLIFVTNGYSLSDTISNSQSKTINENYSTIYVASGFLEAFVLGIDFPIMDDFRLGGKINSVINGGGIHGDVLTSLGGGLKMSYLFKNQENWITVVNVELSYLYRVGHQDHPPYGLSFETTIGNKNKTKGCHVFWNAGFGGTVAPKIPSLFFPCLKIGLLYNI